MAFIILDKESNELNVFGSLPILCQSIGYDEKQEKSLSYVFSTKKQKEFQNEKYRIVKAEFQRGGKSNNKLKSI